jgi:hypothetical protein
MSTLAAPGGSNEKRCQMKNWRGRPCHLLAGFVAWHDGNNQAGIDRAAIDCCEVHLGAAVRELDRDGTAGRGCPVIVTVAAPGG